MPSSYQLKHFYENQPLTSNMLSFKLLTILCVFAAANGQATYQTALAVLSPNNEAYCLTYKKAEAGHKLTFAKCDSNSTAQQWLTTQLGTADDAPWNACLIDHPNLCDSLNEDGEGVLAVDNQNDKKQQWSYNWNTNQYNNGGEPTSKCSQVILGGNHHKTPVGSKFVACDTTNPLQRWYFPGFNL